MALFALQWSDCYDKSQNNCYKMKIDILSLTKVVENINTDLTSTNGIFLNIPLNIPAEGHRTSNN